MGRSQVKYRSTHGRGRGGGRARGSGVEDHSEGSKIGRPTHLRNLGSNAYRFEGKQDQNDEQLEADDEFGGTRTQFFASEHQYRSKEVTRRSAISSGEHFQSRVMKQWEEKDDNADEYGVMGVLDWDSIASHLKLVSPAIRYRMDPRYCDDLPCAPQDDDDNKSNRCAVLTKLNAASPVAVPLKAAQGDEELDLLLHLSACPSDKVKLTPPPSVSMHASLVPIRESAAQSEQLEDWLDDVLDM